MRRSYLNCFIIMKLLMSMMIGSIMASDCDLLTCLECQSNSINECLICKDHYYNAFGICLSCDIACNTCDVISTNCTSCNELSDYYNVESQEGLVLCKQAVCGDGKKFANEECDDGNNDNNDGCDSTCQLESKWTCWILDNTTSYCEPICGDGYHITKNASYEACDDRNQIDNDGCSMKCAVELGWECEEGIDTNQDICKPICGDNYVISTIEQCDDGNLNSNDGCSSACMIEVHWECKTLENHSSACIPKCGDGFRYALNSTYELCDDNNTLSGDGCNNQCAIEDGWTCNDNAQSLSLCSPICGDSKVFSKNSSYEECDDGNNISGDGCSSICGIEFGWQCFEGNDDSNSSSFCQPICGDGIRLIVNSSYEQCDDSNRDDNDGCSSICLIESGWQCLGGSSFTSDYCEPICGDSKRISLNASYEQCDDGNANSGDGCSSICGIEPAWECFNGNSTTNDFCQPICGDGIKLVVNSSYEQCDDTNRNDNDGCSSICQIENGWQCWDDSNTSNSSSISSDYCQPICGDGIKQVLNSSYEQCDDHNLFNNDGCSNICQVENGWECWGGSNITSDYCQPKCGDSERISVNESYEQCDDGNFNSGDGCSQICIIESGWECYNGNSTTKDFCQPICGDGIKLVVNSSYEQCDDHNLLNNDGCSSMCLIENGWECWGGSNTTSNYCQPKCGDSKRISANASYEQCDDGNVNSGDGCSQICGIEPGWNCFNGNSITKDFCQPICGDGTRHVVNSTYEQCDDHNLLNNDGCSSICQIENGWECWGGSNITSDYCQPKCGDSMRISLNASYEQCDDDNVNSGDGCSQICGIEPGWECFNGNLTTKDFCQPKCGDGTRYVVNSTYEQCDDHNLLNNDGCSNICQVENGWECWGSSITTSDYCQPKCGDSMRISLNASYEQCDDGNVNSGDGCSQICGIESGWECFNGNSINRDYCQPKCGDGTRYVVNSTYEQCDDHNLLNNDGCSNICLIENGWECWGGSNITSDYCQPKCGDSMRISVNKSYEQCDDGNVNSGDGCSHICRIEPGWECFNGNSTTQDFCQPKCGDGTRLIVNASYEQCDDHNLLNNDGCSSICLIENDWECWGGSNTSSDYCQPKCGDSKRISLNTSYEQCDDGNVNSGDGCSKICGIEPGWECFNGNSTTQDFCQPKCGDGIRLFLNFSYEQCDDQNILNNDGCSSSCQIEANWQCWADSSLGHDFCQPICGDGLQIIANSTYEQCDDGNIVSLDGCDSKCHIELGWECWNGSLVSSTYCQPICGDGKRITKNSTYEQCDDGNSKNGDGCTSICEVETGYHCLYGSATRPDYCTCEPFNPILRFSDNWEHLLVEFTDELDPVLKDPNDLTNIVNGLVASFSACEIALTKSSILTIGSNYTCQITNKTFYIHFGLRPTIINGTMLYFKPNVLKYKSCSQGFNINSTLMIPFSPMIKPQIYLTTPNTVGLCDDVQIMVNRYAGDGFRDWRNVIFSLIYPSTAIIGSKFNTINAYIRKGSNVNTSVIAFPKAFLDIGITYVFQANVTNFMLLNGTANASISISTEAQPYIGIDTGTNIYNIWMQINLVANADIPRCDGKKSVSGFTAYAKDDLIIVWYQAANAHTLTLSGLGAEGGTPNKLIIPPWTLKLNYVYSFIIKAWPKGRKDLEATKVLQFSVTSSNLISYIEGGNIQLSTSRALILDGSSSRDPDEPDMIIGSDVLSYEWSCQLANGMDCIDFNGEILKFNQSLKIQILEANTLLPGKYYFALEVQRDIRIAYSSVIITIVLGDIPLVSMQLPSQQKGKKINPDQPFTISITVMSKDPDLLQYNWVIYNLQDNTTLNLTRSLTPMQQKTIKIAEWSFIPKVYYNFTCAVNDKSNIGHGNVKLLVNDLPMNGYISISPSIGTAMLTTFTIVTTEWTDTDLPLKYKFVYYLNSMTIDDISKARILTLDYSSLNTFNTILPSGYKSENYMIYIQVLVQDMNGGIGNITQAVNVKPYTTSSPYDNVLRIFTLIESLYESGEYYTSGAYISILSYILNNLNNSIDTNCSNVSCQNQGICNTTTGYCSCSDEFFGLYCEANATVVAFYQATNALLCNIANNLTSFSFSFASSSVLVAVSANQIAAEILDDIANNFPFMNNTIYDMIANISYAVLNFRIQSNSSTSESTSSTSTSSTSESGASSQSNGLDSLDFLNDATIYHYNSIIANLITLNQDYIVGLDSIQAKLSQDNVITLLKLLYLNMLSMTVPLEPAIKLVNENFAMTGLKVTADDMKVPDLFKGIVLPKTGLVTKEPQIGLAQEVPNTQDEYNIIITDWLINPYSYLQTSKNLISNIKSISVQDPKTGNDSIIEKLKNPIIIQIPIQENKNISQVECMWFDTESLNWTGTGCSINLNRSINNMVYCECTHLTDFSVSFDAQKIFLDSLTSANFGYIASIPNTTQLVNIYNYSVFYILVGHFSFLCLMSLWGKQKDIHSRITKNTLIKHKEVVAVNFDLPIFKIRGTKQNRRRRRLGLKNAKKENFFGAFIHAIRMTHILFSIYIRYDARLSRPSRFFLFYLRNILIILTQSIFYAGKSNDHYDLLQAIYIISLSSSLTIILSIFAMKLIETPMLLKNKKRQIHPKIQQPIELKSKETSSWVKAILKIIFFISFLIGSHYIILMILTNIGQVNANYWAITYTVGFILDMSVTQTLKVLFNFGLIVYLGKNPNACKCFRSFFLRTLDRVILTSFK